MTEKDQMDETMPADSRAQEGQTDDSFVPRRDGRFQYAYQCIEHVEQHNCALGCKRGMADAVMFAQCGPGGSCSVLASLSVGDEPVAEITDLGDRLLCTAREPIGEAARRG